jgi:hypothetical protein
MTICLQNIFDYIILKEQRFITNSLFVIAILGARSEKMANFPCLRGCFGIKTTFPVKFDIFIECGPLCSTTLPTPIKIVRADFALIKCAPMCCKSDLSSRIVLCSKQRIQDSSLFSQSLWNRRHLKGFG